MQCPFKGTPLGDWSPSTSVQHHMMLDLYQHLYLTVMVKLVKGFIT